MRSLYNVRRGGPEVLQLREEPDPKPSRGQVVIAVERAGLNFADIQARMGMYPDAPKFPAVMGYEVAGTVQTVGEGVEGLAPGQRVVALTAFKGQSSHVAVPADFVFPIGDMVTFDSAAALPVQYLTAYHMLFAVGRVRSGDRVLIHSAGGGVGLAAIQLLKQVSGVETFGTASASKHALLKEAGYTHLIDYRTQDYAQEIRKLTGGRGVTLILDALGGADWKKGYRLLSPGGHLITFGFANLVKGERMSVLRTLRQLAGVEKYSPMKLMDHNKTVSGVNLGHLWNEREVMSGEMRELLRLLDAGQIVPRVDRVFPLSQAAEAHRFMQERRNVGKVLFDCTK